MVKELNPFEIKAELVRILSKSDRGICNDDFKTLDNCNKNVINKILFKELINIKSENEKKYKNTS